MGGVPKARTACVGARTGMGSRTGENAVTCGRRDCLRCERRRYRRFTRCTLRSEARVDGAKLERVCVARLRLRPSAVEAPGHRCLLRRP